MRSAMRVPNATDLEEGLLMAGLDAHDAARDIEARSLEEGQVLLVRGVFRAN